MRAAHTQRWLSLLLTLVLLLSLAVPAWAADADGTDGPPNQEDTENPGGGDNPDDSNDPDDGDKPDDGDTPGGGTSGSARTTFSFRSKILNFDPGGGDSVIATVHDATSNTRLEWKSSNEEVLKVDYDATSLADTAYFNPIRPGTAKVTVKALDSGFTETLDVTVNGILLLKGNTVTVPENGTVTWTRGVEFERYGTAAEEGVTVSLTCDKSNATCRTMQDGTKELWVFNGIREGNATITAQARTAGGVNCGASVEIRIGVEENMATTIVPPGSYSPTNPLHFSTIESHIAAQCKEMIQDTNNALSFITNLSVSTAEGTLYLGYKNADEPGAGVGSSLSYYVSNSSRGPYLRDIYFVPNPSFTGEKATITFTGTSQGERTFKGKIAVTIAEASTAITLTTPENTPLKFSGGVFSTAFQKVAGVPLSSITFALPSVTQGTLYRGYVNESNYGSRISASDRFTQSEINQLTFVPAEGFVGPVAITYAGYTSAGLRYDGELTISVTQSVDGTIVYYDGGSGQATFAEADFDDYCNRLTGARLGWVTFTLPATSQGTLYYNYHGSTSQQLAVGDVFPYRGTPNISYVTMVPLDGFEGTARVPFHGENENGAQFSGTVEVHFQTAGGGMDITYTCLPGGSVKLSTNDFNQLSQTLTGQRLHYITFSTLPDHTSGALYHNRTSANGIGTRVARDTKYFNSAAPYIMNLSFWASESFRGDLEIPFTGCSVSGQTFHGSLIISSTTTNSYNSTITYSTIGRSPANFVSSQFDDICRAATNTALNYVRFTALPTSLQGNVYFNYQRSELPTTISTSDSFYLSGELSLSNLSFLPAPGFSGTVSLPFIGWSITGAQFQGTVQINVTGGVTGTGVHYTTSGAPVRFSAYDFYNQGGGQPVSIRLDTLPYTTQGKVYYQYTNPTHYSWLATPGMQYGVTSDPMLANLTFIPKAGYRGTVTIPYTATNSGGGTYTGEIRIVVEPATASSYFSDLAGYSADAVSAVDYLYSQGVVNGVSSGRYAPAQSIRRGDFCLMLYRAFQFSSNGTAAAFRDVPAGSYYAQAIDVLRSQGIVNGTGNNSFRPNASISRQDAAVMIQRTLRAAQLNAEDGTEAHLAGFTDSSAVDSYARGAVTCLLQQGLLPVSGETLSPKAALTRADMAILLHRAMAQ